MLHNPRFMTEANIYISIYTCDMYLLICLNDVKNVVVGCEFVTEHFNSMKHSKQISKSLL